jgi:putative peptide zinc metalloprotease protein
MLCYRYLYIRKLRDYIKEFFVKVPVSNSGDQKLPLFRKDLNLYQGPVSDDGSPTYNLYDPVKASYYHLTWAESLVFQIARPGMTTEDLLKAVRSMSTLEIGSQELEDFYQQAKVLHLLEENLSSDSIEAEIKMKESGFFKWLIYNYLYIRLPLIDPDVILSKTLPFVRPLVSFPALLLYFIFTVIGSVQVLTRFSEFIHTFTYFFNWQGLISYFLAIVSVKIIHELAHAYVAKHFKVHVPSMGIAFMVLWPVLYTDVTDSWKLGSRRQRLLISGAGILTELIIAGIATALWAASSAGTFHSICFVVASASWISSLAFNLNPAMRFDGYYLLCDFWGIDNLHDRAFQVARWNLRKQVFGIEAPKPEESYSQRRVWALTFFSIYVWIYRLFIYTLIAVVVYYKFKKAIGIILFAVEIYAFIIVPVFSELSELFEHKNSIVKKKRGIITGVIFSVFAAWFFLPLPHAQVFPAITASDDLQVLYVPLDSTIVSLNIERGQEIQKGESLVQLSSFPLDLDIAEDIADIDVLRAEIFILRETQKDRAFIPEKEAEISKIEEALRGKMAQKAMLDIKAAVKGEVYAYNEILRPGLPVSKDLEIARITDFKQIKVICFVPERDLSTVYLGQKASFLMGLPRREVFGTVKEIGEMRTKVLEYPQLASLFSGDLPVVKGDGNTLAVIETFYATTIEFDEEDHGLPLGLVAEVKVRSPIYSKCMVLFRYITSIIWRESGF